MSTNLEWWRLQYSRRVFGLPQICDSVLPLTSVGFPFDLPARWFLWYAQADSNQSHVISWKLLDLFINTSAHCFECNSIFHLRADQYTSQESGDAGLFCITVSFVSRFRADWSLDGLRKLSERSFDNCRYLCLSCLPLCLQFDGKITASVPTIHAWEGHTGCWWWFLFSSHNICMLHRQKKPGLTDRELSYSLSWTSLGWSAVALNGDTWWR